MNLVKTLIRLWRWKNQELLNKLELQEHTIEMQDVIIATYKAALGRKIEIRNNVVPLRAVSNDD